MQKSTGKVREFCHWKKVGTLFNETEKNPSQSIQTKQVLTIFNSLGEDRKARNIIFRHLST